MRLANLRYIMRLANLQRNEILVKPEDSPIFMATIPRVAVAIHLILKQFALAPKQENLNRLNKDILLQLSVPSVRIASDAYRLGASQVQMPIDRVKLVALQRIAKNSATVAAHQITNTTANVYDLTYNISAGMSKKRVQSKARAEDISKHQMRINFFQGLRYGWSINVLAKKRSFVSSAHDADDVCDDNEDAGAIGIDDVFPSGDYETPFHFGCLCDMILVR